MPTGWHHIAGILVETLLRLLYFPCGITSSDSIKGESLSQVFEAMRMSIPFITTDIQEVRKFVGSSR